MSAKGKFKTVEATPGKILVRIDEKTVIYVTPDKVKGAKERFIERLNSVTPKLNPGGRPGRPTKSAAEAKAAADAD